VIGTVETRQTPLPTKRAKTEDSDVEDGEIKSEIEKKKPEIK